MYHELAHNINLFFFRIIILEKSCLLNISEFTKCGLKSFFQPPSTLNGFLSEISHNNCVAGLFSPCQSPTLQASLLVEIQVFWKHICTLPFLRILKGRILKGTLSKFHAVKACKIFYISFSIYYRHRTSIHPTKNKNSISIYFFH